MDSEVTPALAFFESASENSMPSEPRTIAMRPTVHAAWFAIICASQKPTISMSALQTMTTIGMTSANSENTDAREDFSRRATLAPRFPSFLVSHFSTSQSSPRILVFYHARTPV